MFDKLLSKIKQNKLSEKNINKQIDNCFFMIFDRDTFSKDFVGIKAIKEREDLKKAFVEQIHDVMKCVIASENPHREFRSNIIRNTKIQAVYGKLLSEEFDNDRHKICNAINIGMSDLKTNEVLHSAMYTVTNMEKFSDQPWGLGKIAHEYSWAEVEGLVLRHMQVLVFCERVEKDTDWWGLYRKAYEGFVSDYYNIIVNNTDDKRGFPHPVIASMAIDALIDMENTILNSV